jgi:protein phosphatase PTC6
MAEPSVFYFAVFDGHGGDAASVFLKDYLHQYVEATATLFASEDRERRKELQNQLVDAWKEVGGYFRRFKPDFGLKGAGRNGDGGIAATLSYAFLKADFDFITNTRPWFLSEEETPEQLKLAGKGEKTSFKGGSTATVVLLSTS